MTYLPGFSRSAYHCKKNQGKKDKKNANFLKLLLICSLKHATLSVTQYSLHVPYILFSYLDGNLWDHCRLSTVRNLVSDPLQHLPLASSFAMRFATYPCPLCILQLTRCQQTIVGEICDQGESLAGNLHIHWKLLVHALFLLSSESVLYHA